MIKIAIADDHAILRAGVAEILSKFDELQVTIQASNGRELIDKLASSTLPDVCIIDINMPVMDGYDTATTIRARWPEMKILALSMYDNELSIIRMLRCGAHSYILKDSNPSLLRTAITETVKNGVFYTDLVTGRLVHLANYNGQQLRTELNEKERQFLELCCTEYTYKEIAEKMFLSPRTIDGYREALFSRLNVSSRTGLVMHAIRTGIVRVN